MSKTKKFNMSTIIKVKEIMLKGKINNNGGHKGTKVIGTTKTTKATELVAILIKAIGVEITKEGGTTTTIGGWVFKGPRCSNNRAIHPLSFSRPEPELF